MVRWIPPTEEDASMLAELGISSVEELFQDIPRKALVRKIGLAKPLGEEEVVDRIDGLLDRNKPLGEFDSFLGGGYRSLYQPAVVDGLLQRSEFYTAYTPYQAEASQGTLQAIFEFQSLWAEMTGMEVANASLYDGATAIAEAMLMARRLHPGRRFVVPKSLFWERRSVLENYARGTGAEMAEVPWDPATGELDVDALKRECANDCFGLLVEYPNSIGVLEESLPTLKSLIGDVPLVVAADPLSLLLLEPPGSLGADIVVGEGQGLGSSPSYGGPLLGLMATRKAHVRQMPGRLVGATRDRAGRRAYTLTLQTREQHIRRSRATSNVCTNNALVALSFLLFASARGPRRMRELIESLAERTHHLADALSRVEGMTAPKFRGPFLTDFVVGLDGVDPSRFLEAMAERKILAGTSLADPRPGAAPLGFSGLLTSVDGRVDHRAIDRYAKAAAEVLAELRRSP